MTTVGQAQALSHQNQNQAQTLPIPILTHILIQAHTHTLGLAVVLSILLGLAHTPHLGHKAPIMAQGQPQPHAMPSLMYNL
jgi:hypothetical protein